MSPPNIERRLEQLSYRFVVKFRFGEGILLRIEQTFHWPTSIEFDPSYPIEIKLVDGEFRTLPSRVLSVRSVDGMLFLEPEKGALKLMDFISPEGFKQFIADLEAAGWDVTKTGTGPSLGEPEFVEQTNPPARQTAFVARSVGSVSGYPLPLHEYAMEYLKPLLFFLMLILFGMLGISTDPSIIVQFAFDYGLLFLSPIVGTVAGYWIMVPITRKYAYHACMIFMRLMRWA